MRKLAIITARGGSKRIPRKNIKDFLGNPIIVYSIKAAIDSGIFDEVMVSTDDLEIAELSINAGAKVPFLRSEKNSDDFASTLDVVKEVNLEYSNLGQLFEYSCCIYPTAPFIKPVHLQSGFDKLISQNLDSVFPIVPFSYPIWRSLRKKENKTLMFWPENLNKRSQDLETAYHDAGQWYWMDNAKIDDSIWTDNSGSIELSELEVQDIDNQIDWKLAELKYKLLGK